MPSEQIAISEELKSLIELQVIDTATDLTRRKTGFQRLLTRQGNSLLQAMQTY